MADYAGISPTFFQESEYRDMRELVVASFLIVNSDMIGVCPISSAATPGLCRTSKNKLLEVISYFESIGKLMKSKQDRFGFPNHCWWKSKLHHALYKGGGSEKQIAGAVNLIRRWQNSNVFPPVFESALLQLYATKYNLVIPITSPKQWVSSESYTETETETQAVVQQAAGEKTPNRIRIGKIRELLTYSEFVHCLKFPDSDGWINRLIEHFKEPEFPDNQIEKGLESLFEHQRKNSWRPWPNDNIRQKIFAWIERQVDSPEKSEQDKEDDLDKWLEEDDKKRAAEKQELEQEYGRQKE